jgi:hypothetical protein
MSIHIVGKGICEGDITSQSRGSKKERSNDKKTRNIILPSGENTRTYADAVRGA